jgi:hypothetical protein
MQIISAIPTIIKIVKEILDLIKQIKDPIEKAKQKDKLFSLVKAMKQGRFHPSDLQELHSMREFLKSKVV